MNEDYISNSDTDTDEKFQYTLDDYLNNKITSGILEDNFFESFKKNMLTKIETFYNNEVFNAYGDYLDIFHHDFDSKKSYEFFLEIYPFISKKYDISVFDKNPSLAYSLYEKKEEEEEKIIKKPKTIEKKEFNWGQIKN